MWSAYQSGELAVTDTVFTPELFTTICDRIAEGESLRAICSGEGMPSKTTVLRWLAEPEAASLRDQYARAREEQADTFAAEVVEIADEAAYENVEVDGAVLAVRFDATAVNRNRLRADARKWAASKLAPKKYGERLTHAGDPAAPIGLEHSGTVTLDPGEAYRRLLNGDG